MKLSSLFLMATMAMAFSISSQASKVFQWKDENGQIHYSQFPPAGQAEGATSVNVKTTQGNTEKAAEDLNKLRDKLKQDIDSRNQAKKDAAEQAEKDKELAQACEQAKSRLTGLKNSGRIYKVKEDGEREWYDEQKREQAIKTAQQDVDKYCK